MFSRTDMGSLPLLCIIYSFTIRRACPFGLEGPVLAPEARKLGERGVGAGGQAGGLGGTEGGGLADGGTDDRNSEDVGLQLHEEVVLRGAAVHLERLGRTAAVRRHGLEDLAALEGD